MEKNFKNFVKLTNLLLQSVQVVLCFLILYLVLQRFFDSILTFLLVFVISHLEVHYQPIFYLYGFLEIVKKNYRKITKRPLKTSRIFNLCFKSTRFQCFRTFEMNKT